jgi:hypothetical protein
VNGLAGVRAGQVPAEHHRDGLVTGSAWFGGQGADGLVPRQRPGRVIDQACFELGADRDRTGAEAGPGEQASQVREALLEPLPEPGVVALAELLPGDLGSQRVYPAVIRRPVSTAGRIRA